MNQRRILVWPVLASLLVAIVWSFPMFWFTKSGPENPIWLLEQTNLSGWTYNPTPVSKVEEASLKADKTDAGIFSKNLNTVQVFSAKRFSNDPNEIDLFGHTPDRCWTEAGWRIQPILPETVTLELDGVKVPFERRVFVWKTGQKILVYFTGLNAGQPLPYRLDHHLSLAQKKAFQSDGYSSFLTRNSNPDNLRYIWQVFISRRQIVGPKHFFRLATEFVGEHDTSADQRLQEILPLWLKSGDIKLEAAQWKALGGSARPSAGRTNETEIPR